MYLHNLLKHNFFFSGTPLFDFVDLFILFLVGGKKKFSLRIH